MPLEATGGVSDAVLNLEAAQENYELVAAQTGYRIRVLGGWLRSLAGATISMHEGGDSLSGSMVLTPNVELPLAQADSGWFDTAVGNALLLNTDGDVAGLIRYQIIK